MSKYLIVVPGYPSERNLYNNYFVHSRVKSYLDFKIKVDVFSVKNCELNTYIYDGVQVVEGNKKELYNLLTKNKYDKILIHFGWASIINTIIKATPKTPLIIWVHGVEALGWYRRLFTFELKKVYRFLGYILVNTRQLLFMHNFIRNQSIDKTFVFVSNWMKDILEKDSLSKGKINKYIIIPNVIDDKEFPYQEKSIDKRLNVLSIRTYQSKKYANDLSVKAVLNLSKEDFFNNLKFSFYGDGKLFDKTLKPLKKFENVKIEKKFLNHEEIKKTHLKNGIMLIPTRQDAQGVSMCEAMSSGLVPVTSNNTAIPEYVNSEVGYLTNNYKELSNAIKDLYLNPEKFKKMSKKTSQHIMEICSPKVVIKKELDLIINK